jgi:hypothetical protein
VPAKLGGLDNRLQAEDVGTGELKHWWIPFRTCD